MIGLDTSERRDDGKGMCLTTESFSGVLEVVVYQDKTLCYRA